MAVTPRMRHDGKRKKEREKATSRFLSEGKIRVFRTKEEGKVSSFDTGGEGKLLISSNVAAGKSEGGR